MFDKLYFHQINLARLSILSKENLIVIVSFVIRDHNICDLAHRDRSMAEQWGSLE